MNRLLHGLGLPLAAAGVALIAGAADADSRMFGARSSEAGVAIVGAVANGKQLAVASQGGGVTFFRIDNPGGTVPCANRISFTGSNGAVVAVDADVCANGGQLTVVFGAPAPAAASSTEPKPQPAPPQQAQTPAPATPPVAATPPPLPATQQPAETATVSTDDPDVSIQSVFLSGQEVAIERRVGNAVEIKVPAAAGCMRDLGLVLSDGRRIARDMDFCAAAGKIVVQLIGSGAAPATAAAPPPAPPPAAAPPRTDASRWMFSSEGGQAHLTFGVPDSEDITFDAGCTAGSSAVTITIEHSAPEVQPGAQVTVGFAAGAFSRTYPATGSKVSQMTGQSNAVIKATTSDPLWAAIIKESFLGIQIGGGAPFGMSLSGSAAAARQFLAACSPQEAVQPMPPPAVGGGADAAGGPAPITYQCDDGTAIFVTFYDDEDAALVAEPDVPPRYLRRAPSSAGVLYAAGGARLVGRTVDITWQRPGKAPIPCQPR
jgi:hypothetical protein